ncbi:MAG: tRNA (adenosine(37)-N6)-threonylcarbamoyltransferase complex dimerization subunit type 1 TsaB [Anaerolineae bacterium]
MLLAIDTATRTASLALYDAEGVQGETTWWARENHTVSLMPQFSQLLQVCRVDLDRISAIGVATGPGSFTGLRIGLSAAKGLALARTLPLIGVPTLDGLAHAFAYQSFPIWALLQAGRGRYAAAPYAIRAGRGERKSDYLVVDAAGLVAGISTWMQETGAPRVLVCGELDTALRSVLAAQLGERVVLADAASSLRRATYLAELAWHSWQAGQTSDLDMLAPYYIPTASLPQPMGL